jgi:hypothetical protein
MQSTSVRVFEKVLIQDEIPNNDSLGPSEYTDTTLGVSCGFPDGGRDAWLAVLGGHLALFAAVGVMNSFVRLSFFFLFFTFIFTDFG